ncbi:hypothetical protein LOZ61_006373 [Ophidiomyces ophidiicola]|nr:hypothetical protein LOZ61_006373 [Ophidiomyces ophidiicola]KAI1921844.1 hypothetical protein LOZ60_006056 [Ophidiomyces ophidiicola]KAI1957310.1 hypothetical protein LOZ59_003977 [Ophidiomyces ophidiicola]KAI2009616.1 hypothetical protein LOZ49_003810 [Ophidiomyces ophidiicola]KAI2018754.1 hypothetical protein LOZ46_003646 [Ophidiomyces ophidiicola]
MSRSSTDSSSLSSAVSVEDEAVAASINRKVGIKKYFQRENQTESPPPKRAPSPPHEYVLADNPNIAFIVMFRARFSDVFPKSLPNYGPQDIEKGVADTVPGDQIERLLCAVVGLVLNRKKDVERGHYQRALEEAVQTHQTQWPKSWAGKNPLQGGRSFANMPPEERLSFLKTLVLWALSSSDAVQAKLKESYKQSRQDGDRNQPLSVQPWGSDSYKRRYWLVEGRDDTHFRLYRESNPALKTNTWWSVAGTIGELSSVATTLGMQKSRAAKDLSERIRNSIPRFEASEEKRKRREYRLARKAAFTKPEPGFSLYEGRTRGKRMKYTFSDEEDLSDEPDSRKSTRQQTRGSSPGEPQGPTYTASGRQVKARVGGIYGEAMTSRQRANLTHETGFMNGRPQRSTRLNGLTPGNNDDYNSVDAVEEDDEPDAASSGQEWEGGDENSVDEDDDMSDAASLDEDDTVRPSLVVQLRYNKDKAPPNPTNSSTVGSADGKTMEAKAPHVYDSASPSILAVHLSNPPADSAFTPTKFVEPIKSIPEIHSQELSAPADYPELRRDQNGFQ